MSVNHRDVPDGLGLKNLDITYDCGVICVKAGAEIKLTESVIRPYDMKRWAHSEICNRLFGSEGGISLQSVVGFLSDVSGVSTPDHVIVQEKRVVIQEVKTSLSKSSSAYVAATRQYLHVLRSANWEYKYLCLGASPYSVTWDDGLDLSDQDLSFIVTVMQISKRIQDKLLQEGVLLDDYILSSTTLNVPHVSLSKESRLSIDDKLIDYWRTLDVSSVSGSMIMLESAKRVPDITIARTEDEKELKSLYTDGLVTNEMPFKVGLMIPSIDETIEYETDAEIDNDKLQYLWKAYVDKRKSGGEKSCKITASNVNLDNMSMDDGDLKKGLWAGIMGGKNSGLFRSNDGKGIERKSGPVRLLSRPMTRLKNRRGKRYAPTEMDLNTISMTLCTHVKTSFPEPKQTLIDKTVVELPFQSEYWFQATKFWQRLVEEINVGRYSSQGKWNTFHCHQICPYNAWIFVHGTGLHSHQFYFLVFHTRDPVCWPNDLVEFHPGWWCTQCIKSLRSDKINQHLNILERLISLRYYWNSVLGTSFRSNNHFAASFLIAYDSKQQTIDTLALFRYIYMEFCKSADTRNPAKVVSKLPHELRSPILAWVVYRMKKLILNTSQLQPALKKTKQNTSRMNFKGLVSWVDFEPIKNFNVILSLSYMHYATSHPVSIGLHGKIQIMGKLIKEEKKLDFGNHEYSSGNNDTLDLGPHEYSSRFVKKVAHCASQRLLFVYPAYDSLLKVFSHRLLRWRLSDFATFKKSTMVTDLDPGKRAYCFEEIIRLADHLKLNPLNASNYSPYVELSKLIKYQEGEPRNRNVSIFVKDQQSGLREIFVLPMNLRILIKSMEIFARIVNETFPNETLSYPKRKDLVVTEHIRKSQVQTIALKKQISDKNGKVIMLRYSSSSDAKAWCQQFCMPVFGCFITSLLYESYGEESMDLIRYFCFILNQITGKHIHVDQRVKEWLKSARDVETGVDYLEDLLGMYQGKKEGLYEDDSIINMSNMMQGIPHETSSSLHASYLLFTTMILKSLIAEQITKKLKLIKLGVPVIDSLVSSDDSGILFSLPVLVEEENGRLKKGHETELTELKKILYKLGYSIELNKRMFSAEASLEKSTIFAESPVFEFNSRFYIGRSVATAEIKFAVSPLTLGFHTGIVDRMSEALSSLKGCVKEGLRQDQLMIVQQCLRRMHIRFLYTDWWDADLSSRLDASQSPRLGVLPMVRQGLIGFLNLPMISDYARLLGSPSYWPIRKSVQCLIDGTEGYSLMLRVGRKYQQVLKTLSISRESVIAEMKRLGIGPMRFLKRELPESMLIRIKLLSPGAKVALSYVDLAKIHMASCYASTTDCITVGHDNKLSLVNCLELEDLCLEKKYLPPVTELTSELAYMEEILNCGYLDYVEKDQTKISTEVVFRTEGQDVHSMLVKCWETGFSAAEKESLATIQELIPGIKDTVEETMENFDSVFTLESYLRNLSQKGLSVNVLSYASGSKNFLYSYQTYLRSNWSREHSFIVHGSAVNRIKIDVFQKAEVIRWHNDLEDKLSLLSGSIRHPPLDRLMITGIQKHVLDNTIPVESLSNNLSDLLVYLGSKNSVQRFDLSSFRSPKRKVLGYKPNLVYIFDRGSWYTLAKEKEEWILYRGEQSPRLPYIECKYVVRDNLPIWVDPKDLRIKVDKATGLTVHSNYWNSDCFKELKAKFPHLRTDHAWVEIRPGPFSFDSLLEYLPSEYRTETCERLLTASHLDSDRSCGDFDFWVMVSDILSGDEYSKEEKSVARSIMSIATEEEGLAEEYDPFQEVVNEDIDPEENAEISKFLAEEMGDWLAGCYSDSEPEADFGGLTLAQDFSDWCMDDLVESYEEKGYRPNNSLFQFHWRFRIRSGYSRSFTMHAHRNRHNQTRHNRIVAARGQMVFLNPERFGEQLPD